MAKEIPSVGDLRKAAEIADHEIEAVVDAYSADPRAGPFRFASGYEIHVARAIERHMPAKMALADADRTPTFKRNTVRTAILRAYPVRQ
jgi:hypothetical protein